MNNIPKVSIIIPVYNQKLYIRRCLDSVINQSLVDIEIIIINDGSTDNSLNIINEYIEFDQRILLINQKNQGLSIARNTGIIKAQGKYLAFIDSDDYIEKDMFLDMFNNANLNNSDIVVCGYKKVSETKILYTNNLKNEENFENMILGILGSTAWNRIYKKELFSKNKIIYPPKLFHEDMATTFKLYFFAKKITKIQNCYYNWFTRDNSISENFKIKHLLDLFKGFDILINFLKKHNIHKENKTLLSHKYILLIKLILTKIDSFVLDIEERNNLYKILFKKMKNSIYLSKKNLKIIYEEYPHLYHDITFIKSNKNFYLEKENDKLKEILKDKYCFKDENNIILKNNIKDNLKLLLLKRRTLYDLSNKEVVKYNFSLKMNNLFNSIRKIKQENKKIAIYGNGIVGNILAKELEENLVVIFDKNLNSNSEFAELDSICNINKHDFDVLVISVLGREKEIKKELTSIKNKKDFKIYELNITS